MEPMGQVTLQVTLAILVMLVILAQLVKWSRDLTLPILEPMKAGSQMILFMTQMLEKIRQTRDCKITQVLKLELLMGQTLRQKVAMITQA